jgi:hypothetical protein
LAPTNGHSITGDQRGLTGFAAAVTSMSFTSTAFAMITLILVYICCVSVEENPPGVHTGQEPRLAVPLMDFPEGRRWWRATNEDLETEQCPVVCRAERHRCWYASLGLEVATVIRNWFSRPVSNTSGAVEVLEELYEEHFEQPTLQEVVTASLRHVRESLEQSVDTVIEPQIEVAVMPPAEITEQNVTDGEAEVKPTGREFVRGRPRRVRRHRNIVPLMSLRCRRSQRGLLGPIPGSVAWAQEYCRSLLRNSRS